MLARRFDLRLAAVVIVALALYARTLGFGFSYLDDDTQLVVYRVAQEALSNATRHSGAGHITVRLRRSDEDGVELDVSDDAAVADFFDTQVDAGRQRCGTRENAPVHLEPVVKRPQSGNRY